MWPLYLQTDKWVFFFFLREYKQDIDTTSKWVDTTMTNVNSRWFKKIYKIKKIKIKIKKKRYIKLYLSGSGVGSGLLEGLTNYWGNACNGSQKKKTFHVKGAGCSKAWNR